jgi:general secretion pathway protein A
MYLDFYRLKSAPFPITPDPTWLFLSTSHQAALEAMTSGIAARQGFVAITGAKGVGKTTLVRSYLARVVPPQLTTIVSWQARLSFLELLALMVCHFAVPGATDDTGAMLAQLEQLLWHEVHQGRNVVLIIDEAQDLPRETLEQLPSLANLSPSGEPSLQIVLVGEPALLLHLRRRGLRRMAQHIGSRATLLPLTEAESLRYIRQRVAKVALPGGPIFTQGALQAIVRHAHGVPHDVNLLCTNVLLAGFWAQQQPITAALVQEVIAASRGSRLFPLGRLGLAAVAGLGLTAALLWGASFSAGPQVSRNSSAARAHSSLQAPPGSTSAPPLVAPRLPPPEPAPQAQALAEATPGSAVAQDPGEDHVRLVPLESLENQSPKTPPARLPPQATRPPPATSMGIGWKSCDELKAEIQAKLDAKRITGYSLTIMAREDVKGHQIIGSCEGSTKKIALNRWRPSQ